MTSWSSPTAANWGGRPIVRQVSEVVPRSRAVLIGVVQATTVRTGRGRSFDAELADGTGSVLLRFVGRVEVPGVVAGAHLVVEGTASPVGDHLVLLNPLYRFATCGA